MKNTDKTEQVIFKIHTAEAGWLDFTITVGEQSFSDSFSHVFDPLYDLKWWLEDISRNVQQTSFKYDNEGKIIQLDFSFLSSSKKVFTISKPHQDNRVCVQSRVDSKQLVGSFYTEIIEFANSDKYDPHYWEQGNYSGMSLQKVRSQLIDNYLK